MVVGLGGAAAAVVAGLGSLTRVTLLASVAGRDATNCVVGRTVRLAGMRRDGRAAD